MINNKKIDESFFYARVDKKRELRKDILGRYCINKVNAKEEYLNRWIYNWKSTLKPSAYVGLGSP